MVSPLENPLAEVFGFPSDNFSERAERFRENKLCPYNNKVPNCTKDKKEDPLGVCSINSGDDQVITCPVRFREEWVVAEEAADFFFPDEDLWTTLLEIRINDHSGKSAGNIDLVSVSYDSSGQVQDFGALEIQAVYISGNVRNPFEKYMEDPQNWSNIDWKKEADNYPSPDWYSSEKRLITQLRRKGAILNEWGKKQAVALQSGFYDTLPNLPQVDRSEADMAWFIYDLEKDRDDNAYHFEIQETIYTEYEETLKKIATTEAGPLDRFVNQLQGRLDEKLEDDSSETESLQDTLKSGE